ncbi:sulfatase-like hydrolase/transferase [Sediminicola luteus]|uniref:N-acetylgalactosamine 6-sulfate sulfatase n=1 Tax=Sediminicola luteus TaxID=319238 RepID=A0A2A4G7G7_9FLAO|nr:sulfatase-like hydrolase/transferase [Sediminicola luteus]PCE63936.1 N-acetylgalactosamine 6-sulfate sulfatase [Sediminicola luteus]
MRKTTNYLIPLLFCAVFGGNAQSPNIILVMTDDQGWLDAGFNGNTEIQTPHLDKMASDGIILDRFYSASAVCSPTRASVVTGRNPLRMGIPNANTGHLKTQELTLAEILKTQGYATGHFGKWHLGTLTTQEKDANRGGQEKNAQHFSIPSMHGYDTFFCTESKVPTYDPMRVPQSFDAGESKRYGWKAVEGQRKDTTYGTFYWDGHEQKVTQNLKGDDSQVIMDRVIPFMEMSVKAQKPFFSTIWFHTPHLPVVADSAQRAQYAKLDLRKQIYYGTLTAMDQQMGRLWEKLEKMGVAENTMIWFCSDNGPENRTPGSAGKFRARKRSLYEGGVRVPAFVIWKKVLQGGSRNTTPMVTSDYLPTLLEVLNIKYPSTHPLDGESVWTNLSKGKHERKKPIGFLYGNQYSLVNNRYKYLSPDKGKTYELYDLINDPEEKHNIISENRALAQKMHAELNSWMVAVDASAAGKDYK